MARRQGEEHGEFADEPELRQLGYAADAGAQAHYLSPEYYEKAYRDRLDDVTFYRDAALAAGGEVLEYGAGTGRIGLEIARAGVGLTGVDLARPMLDAFREKLKREEPALRKRVRLKEGDMRKLRLRRRFALVIAPFNTFLHLYTRQDVEAFLGCVRSHLQPGGSFLFDYSIPRCGDLALDPARWYGSSRIRHPGRDQLVRYAERFEYDALRQVMQMSIRFTPAGGAPWYVPLTHRQFYPQEMEALLHYNGFAEQEWSADFSGKLPDESVDTLVVRCRPTPVRRKPAR